MTAWTYPDLLNNPTSSLLYENSPADSLRSAVGILQCSFWGRLRCSSASYFAGCRWSSHTQLLHHTAICAYPPIRCGYPIHNSCFPLLIFDRINSRFRQPSANTSTFTLLTFILQADRKHPLRFEDLNVTFRYHYTSTLPFSMPLSPSCVSKSTKHTLHLWREALSCPHSLIWLDSWNSPFTNCNTWENDQHFFTKLPWDVANWYTTHWCPQKIVVPRTMNFFHIHASKFIQTQATWLHLDCSQTPSI